MTKLADNPKKNAKTSGRSKSEATKSERAFPLKKEKTLIAQNFLRNNGFEDVDCTAKLDRKTRSAIRSFQKSENLKISGTLDIPTFERIEAINLRVSESFFSPAHKMNTGDELEPVFHAKSAPRIAAVGKIKLKLKPFSVFAFEDREDFLLIGGGLIVLAAFLIIAFS